MEHIGGAISPMPPPKEWTHLSTMFCGWLCPPFPYPQGKTHLGLLNSCLLRVPIVGISYPCGCCYTLWISPTAVEYSFPLNLSYPCVFFLPDGFLLPLSYQWRELKLL